MTTQEQIQSALEQSLPSIVESIKAELKTNAVSVANQQLADLIRKEVSAWYQASLSAEILTTLEGERAVLVETATALGESLKPILVEGFQDAIKEQLKNSWGRKKIFEALLG